MNLESVKLQILGYVYLNYWLFTNTISILNLCFPHGFVNFRKLHYLKSVSKITFLDRSSSFSVTNPFHSALMGTVFKHADQHTENVIPSSIRLIKYLHTQVIQTIIGILHSSSKIWHTASFNVNKLPTCKPRAHYIQIFLN